MFRTMILHCSLIRMKRRKRSPGEGGSGIACAGCEQKTWSRPTGINLQ
jgi:hypothetical protein